MALPLGTSTFTAFVVPVLIHGFLKVAKQHLPFQLLLKSMFAPELPKDHCKEDYLHDKVSKRVQEVMLRERSAFIQSFYSGTYWLNQIILLFILIHLLLRKTLPLPLPIAMLLVLYSTAMSYFITSHSVEALLSEANPKAKENADRHFYAAMAIFMGGALAGSTDCANWAIFQIPMAGRIFLSLTYKEARPVLCSNLVFSIVNCVVLCLAPEAPFREIDVSLLVLWEIGVSAVTIILSQYQRKISWESHYRTIAAEFSQAQGEAARSLLGNFCDGVVETDASLQIVKFPVFHDTQPLCTDIADTLKGGCLLDLIVEEDRELLNQQLQTAELNSSYHGSFTLCSHGTFAKIALFFTAFESFADGKHFLVGLRESLELVSKHDSAAALWVTEAVTKPESMSHVQNCEAIPGFMEASCTEHMHLGGLLDDIRKDSVDSSASLPDLKQGDNVVGEHQLQQKFMEPQLHKPASWQVDQAFRACKLQGEELSSPARSGPPSMAGDTGDTKARVPANMETMTSAASYPQVSRSQRSSLGDPVYISMESLKMRHGGHSALKQTLVEELHIETGLSLDRLEALDQAGVLSQVPRNESGEITSIGSINHEEYSDQCTSCKFWRAGRCSNGLECSYCHLPHPEVKMKNKPNKLARQQRRANRLLDEAVQVEEDD